MKANSTALDELQNKVKNFTQLQFLSSKVIKMIKGKKIILIKNGQKMLVVQ